MITGILITDHGPHSHEDWALTTAGMLMNAFTIKDGSPRRAQLEIAKGRAQATIAEVMVEHHKSVQKKERDLLAVGDHERINSDLSPEEHTDVDQAIADVRKACQPLMDILNSAEVKPGVIGSPVEHLTFESALMETIRQRVMMDLKSVIDIERSWHADRHDNEHSDVFKAARTKSGMDHFIQVVE